MLPDARMVMAWVSAGAALAGLAQLGLGCLCAWRFTAQAAPGAGQLGAPLGERPGVTILKPLHGDEPLLEEALASFCAIDWPGLQILCGVQSAGDPAIAVVRRLQARFAQTRIDLVINPAQHGHNRKISNLINMLPQAAHDVLVISDSDMHAPPGYLPAVFAALQRPGSGLVTSLYVGRSARPSLIASLASAHIAQIFIPGALLARAMGRQDCLGATMALTRQTLAHAGGLEALLPYVADDAVLGQNVARLGLSVQLAQTIPATSIQESSPASLWQHELRWARTIRSIEPLLFTASVLQFPSLFALLAACLAGFTPPALAGLAAALVLRAALGRAAEASLGAQTTPLWLAPLRDALSTAIWMAAHFSNRVAWRGQVLATFAPGPALPPAGASFEGPRT